LINRGLIDRFYKGECSPEEVHIVLKWFQANQLDPEQEQALHALWHQAGQMEAEEGHARDRSRMFSKIKEQLQESQHPEQEEAGSIIRFLQLQQPQFWFKAVAAVLLPLCLIWALVQYTSKPKTTAAVCITIAAAPGIKKTINLPDGSVVKLNAGSKVTFPKSFDADKREILLSGEAFFKVAKDSLRPFIVHTGSISTQALGTSFNINYSSDNDAITVALVTGMVKIDKQEQGQRWQIARLVPGQQLSYSKASQRYAVAAFDRSKVLGWKEF